MSRVLKTLTKKAQSEVDRLEQAVARWQGEADAKRAELVELRASMGERIFAGTASREIASVALDLQFQIDGAEAATVVAEQQLAEARDDLTMARAEEMRAAAAKLTEQADALQVKVDVLLRQLTELDGATYVPDPGLGYEDRQAVMLAEGQYVHPAVPLADVLRDEAGDLLVEVQKLEAPVLERRAARARAAAPLVSAAEIDVPAWDDIDSLTTLTCRVTEGAGSAVFEVRANGQQGGTWTVTLPDEAGRRAWSRQVKIQAGGGAAVIRCNGEVVAKATRPGRLMSNEFGSRWWVQLSPEERAAL